MQMCAESPAEAASIRTTLKIATVFDDEEVDVCCIAQFRELQIIERVNHMQTKDLRSLYLQSPKLNQLNILREVAANSHTTQAELAGCCSLSVAMVNNYMKELCGAGFLEYRRKTTKSVTYYLTPAGKQYLETLQSELFKEMVGMFVEAKEQIRARILSQAQAALQRVVLFGSGHLAQMAFHALELTGARILGVCDDNIETIGSDFCGRKVANPSQIRFMAPDAVIVADSARAEEICRSLDSLSRRGISIIRLDEKEELGSLENLKAIPDRMDLEPSLDSDKNSKHADIMREL
jgi:DNA-binding MarR family transcriptional regulator